ncbi:MAG: hypothetical protein FWC09_00095 [Lachnospiraceae bacterium]|nr:hypothetical protein [Lachnospiraceae bacterium]
MKDLNVLITGTRRELDALLSSGDSHSLLKSIKLLNETDAELFQNDDGIRYTYLFQKIWLTEVAQGEKSIFTNVRNVEDVMYKLQLVRHSFFRLENDFPLELCLESIKLICDLDISNTAFNEIVTRYTEDSDKIIARIHEVNAKYA